MAQPVPGSQTLGKTRKKKVREKLAGGKRKKFPPDLFSCLLFLNSSDPTISEPGTGYIWPNFVCSEKWEILE